jgi:hypothetical protein
VPWGTLKRVAELEARKFDLEYQFHRKYGRMPQYRPESSRDFSSTPIR